ncbi:hypothetical protein QBC47DRAFT_97231 [Echria macrotheca]|uniref:Uncharacterized protein n=1 Tax=Echria macrotheca TaxID=438768 RepID=A0AAJ0BIM7_9PEZI|nr:hypothetical protein QBC47DRAFT_97231 [Echria macrotheca]
MEDHEDLLCVPCIGCGRMDLEHGSAFTCAHNHPFSWSGSSIEDTAAIDPQLLHLSESLPATTTVDEILDETYQIPSGGSAFDSALHASGGYHPGHVLDSPLPTRYESQVTAQADPTDWNVISSFSALQGPYYTQESSEDYISTAGPSGLDLLTDRVPSSLADSSPAADIFSSHSMSPQSYLSPEDTTMQQQELLVNLRQQGMRFEAIAERMRMEFGVDLTANALVKRYQKLQKSKNASFLRLALATARALPDMKAAMKRELGDGIETEAEMAEFERLLEDLPRIMQNRYLRKRKQ